MSYRYSDMMDLDHVDELYDAIQVIEDHASPLVRAPSLLFDMNLPESPALSAGSKGLCGQEHLTHLMKKASPAASD